MLEIFENAITDSELDYLNSEFNKLKTTRLFKDEIYYIDHADTLKEMYEQNETVVQQCRFKLNGLPIGNKVVEILRRFANNEDDIKTLPIWASVAEFPIGIHADVPENYFPGNTFLIPLTFDDNIKTVVWKPLLGLNLLNNLIQDFGKNGESYPIKSTTSKQVDVKHCWLSTPTIVDAMELDGIASWKKGTLIKCDRRQPHASNNWKPFVDFKHYIVIHAR